MTTLALVLGIWLVLLPVVLLAWTLWTGPVALRRERESAARQPLQLSISLD